MCEMWKGITTAKPNANKNGNHLLGNAFAKQINLNLKLKAEKNACLAKGENGQIERVDCSSPWGEKKV